MRSPRRTAVLTVIFAVLTLLALGIRHWMNDTATPDVVAVDPGSVNRETSADPAPIAHGRTERDTGSPARLLIVTRESGAPLSGATSWSITDPSGQTLPPDLEPIAEADESGRMVLPGSITEFPYLLVRHPTRVPVLLRSDALTPDAPEQRIEMEVACRVHVTVLHEDGGPIHDARVKLSSSPLDADVDLAADAAAHPLAKRPTWTGTTDRQGRAEFGELPAGRYWLNSYHDHYAPNSDADLDHKIDLHAEARATLVMRDMYGVAFACPSKAPIRTVHWQNQLMSLDISGPVVLRLDQVRSAFEQRFPDCAVFVHRPREVDSAAEARCWVRLEDDTVWTGARSLRPFREIEAPEFLAQELDTLYRSVSVQLESASGEPLDLLVGLRHLDSGRGFWMDPGETVPLPYGRYSIGSVRVPRTFQKMLDEISLTVSATEPATDQIRIRLPEDYAILSVDLELPTEDALAPIHFRVRSDLKESFMAMNWVPSQGPLRFPFKPANVTIRTTSVGYEDVERVVDLREEQRITLRLTERD